ncbi:DUF4376 domain-containing protein [Oceanimonas sp. NS1]|nr:DUF4376 domain-containing protein [Oceanimonas sp. NS1]
MIIRHSSPQRRERVNQARDQAVAAGFDWGGHRWQIDANSRAAIANRALRLLLDPDTATVEWRNQDNALVPLSRDQFFELARAVDAHIEQLYQLSWQQKINPRPAPCGPFYFRGFMSITVSGILKTPAGNLLANTEIKFQAVANSSNVLQGTTGLITTGNDGSYSATLAHGSHRVTVRQGNTRPETIGLVHISADTTANTLNDLLLAASAASPGNPWPTRCWPPGTGPRPPPPRARRPALPPRRYATRPRRCATRPARSAD